MFPFEEYRKAIDDESSTRNGGVEVMVVRAEEDDARGSWILLVEPHGKCDWAELEEGTAVQVGEECVPSFAGEILSYDEGNKLLSVKAGAIGVPMPGTPMMVYPPDYLKKLREFAAKLVEDPKAHAPLLERFMNLREDLLASTADKEPAWKGNAFLRPSQQAARVRAFNRAFSFVWGPPGTGKSYTLGQIAAEFVAQGKRVLVLANTNAAVDVTTFALDAAFTRVGNPLQSGELVRYTRTLTQREEYARRPHLLAYTKLLEEQAKKRCEVEKKLKAAEQELCRLSEGDPELGTTAFRVAAFQQELQLLDERRKAAVAKLLAEAKILCASVTCCLYNGFHRDDFDVVLVDEASLIPLAVWPCLLATTRQPRYVVAGDPMQLVPVSARSEELATHSWFDNNIYAYLGMTEYRGIECFIRARSMTLLTEQTRMRKGICEAVSKMFYSGLVVGDRSNPRLGWSVASGVPNGDVVLIDPGKCPESFGIGRIPSGVGPNTNSVSANVVLELVRRIERNAPPERDLSIEIITPFRNQARRIYGSCLRGRDKRGRIQLSSATIHCCQGSEADIVILDLVNPSSWFLNKQEAAHLWCVACSRAKEQLFVVGETAAVRRGRYSGPLFRNVKAVGLKMLKNFQSTPGNPAAA